MHLLENELARRFEGSRVVLRAEPLRVHWSIDDLTAADGHRVRCAFSCRVRAIDDPSERKMLVEALLTRKAIAFDGDVAEHFAPALRDALSRAAAEKSGVDLVSDAGRHSLGDTLKDAAKPVAFACGVEVLPPFDLQVDSPTLQEQRLRSMQRAIAEERAAGQLEHVQRAGELLKQFQSVRQTAPELSAGQILQQVTPADRGALLQTLLLAAAKETKRDLWAVAGQSLVKLTFPTEGAPTHELFPLPATLGPLRSVQPAELIGGQVLLVGARSGVFMVSPDDPAVPRKTYVDPDVTSQLGFSRVALIGFGREVCACHSEAGVVIWKGDQPDLPSRAIRLNEMPISQPSSDSNGTDGNAARQPGPRNLQTLLRRSITYSVGNKVVVMDDERPVHVLPPQSPADVVGIIPGERNVTIVHEDGTVCTLDLATFEVISSERRAGRICAAAPLPWLGGSRLLLASEEGPVYCVGADDDLVTQYVSAHRDLRMVAASAERVVAVSSDRQRLVVWNAWDGRKPVAEIYLAGIVRHRIADVDFA